MDVLNHSYTVFPTHIHQWGLIYKLGTRTEEQLQLTIKLLYFQPCTGKAMWMCSLLVKKVLLSSILRLHFTLETELEDNGAANKEGITYYNQN